MTLNLEGQLLFPCLENAAPPFPCFICSCWESRSQSTSLSFVKCFHFLPRGSENFFSFSLKSNNSKLIIHAAFLGNPLGPFQCVNSVLYFWNFFLDYGLKYSVPLFYFLLRRHQEYTLLSSFCWFPFQPHSDPFFKFIFSFSFSWLFSFSYSVPFIKFLFEPILLWAPRSLLFITDTVLWLSPLSFLNSISSCRISSWFLLDFST